MHPKRNQTHTLRLQARSSPAAPPLLRSCLCFARRGLSILRFCLPRLEPLPHIVRILPVRIILCFSVVNAAATQYHVTQPCTQAETANSTAEAASRKVWFTAEASNTFAERMHGSTEDLPLLCSGAHWLQEDRTRSQGSGCTSGRRPCWSHVHAATRTQRQRHPPWLDLHESGTSEKEVVCRVSLLNKVGKETHVLPSSGAWPGRACGVFVLPPAT